MIAIPAAVLIVLAVIAVAWSPLFALIFAVPAFVAFLAFVGMRPRADENATPPTGSAETYEDDTPKGAWGEPRPN
jgi:hypothetical protein